MLLHMSPLVADVLHKMYLYENARGNPVDVPLEMLPAYPDFLDSVCRLENDSLVESAGY